MNDPMKAFVEQHREEFDHLEAPVLQLDQLKRRMQSVPEVRKSSSFRLNVNRWLVAASILMTITCAWLFFYSKDKESPAVQLTKNKTTATEGAHVNNERKNISENPIAKVPSSTGKRESKPLSVADVYKVKYKEDDVNKHDQDLYSRLKDSTSASSRLLAILEIEKQDRIDDELLQMLALTLNHDKNTNVRLAALSLMEKANYDGRVSSLLVSSLEGQDDPVVQLGLVSILGKTKNIDINDKLESLASSPDTFAAVRDEAYSILLKENKL